MKLIQKSGFKTTKNKYKELTGNLVRFEFTEITQFFSIERVIEEAKKFMINNYPDLDYVIQFRNKTIEKYHIEK